MKIATITDIFIFKSMKITLLVLNFAFMLWNAKILQEPNASATNMAPQEDDFIGSAIELLKSYFYPTTCDRS